MPSARTAFAAMVGLGTAVIVAVHIEQVLEHQRMAEGLQRDIERKEWRRQQLGIPKDAPPGSTVDSLQRESG